MFTRFLLFAGYLTLPVILSFFYRNGSFDFVQNFLELSFPIGIAFFAAKLSGNFNRKTLRVLFAFLLLVSIFCFEVLELISFYLQGESFNQRFFFHTTPDAFQTGVRAYTWLFFLFLIPTVSLPVADGFLSGNAEGGGRPFLYACCFAAVLLVLPNAPKTFYLEYSKFNNLSKAGGVESVSAVLSDYNVHISDLTQKQFQVSSPAKPKNLVFIYLESLEASYFDENIFPGLVPNLKKEMDNALVFSSIRQFPGTSWTIGGIFASQCGMPLLVGGNDSLYQNEFLKNINCLGDVLQKAGYYQVYMGGADLRFAGKGDFFFYHGYNEVLGYDELSEGNQDPAYRTAWGLYDDTLLNMAVEKYEELSLKDQPFNLTLLTLDTHHPNGHASAGCPEYGRSENSMLQAVHCTDYLVGKFLDEIRSYPNYENTLVFVMSDHLAMRNVASKYYPVERKLTGFAINSGIQKEVAYRGSHFDIPSTILEMLEITSDSGFALGQSMVQPENPDRLKIFDEKNGNYLRNFIALKGKEKNGNISLLNGIAVTDVSKALIDVGGKEIVMSFKGEPLIPEEHIFVASYELGGDLIKYEMTSEDEITEILEQKPDSIYFLMSRRAAFPYEWRKDDNKDGVWHWFLGCPSSLHYSEGTFQNLEEFRLTKEQCVKSVHASRSISEKVFALRQNLYKAKQHSLMLEGDYTARSYGFYPKKIEIQSNGGIEKESYFVLDDSRIEFARGLSVISVNPLGNRIIRHSTYDTYASVKIQNQMAEELRRIDDGNLIFIVGHDSAVREDQSLSPSLSSEMKMLGAELFQRIQIRQPYILIAKKGRNAVYEKRGNAEESIRLSVSETDIFQKTWNYCYIHIRSAGFGNGESFVEIDNKTEMMKRGLNLIVIREKDCSNYLFENYDTFDSVDAAAALAEKLQTLTKDDIFLLVGHDSIIGGKSGEHLPDVLIDRLHKMGAVQIENAVSQSPYIFFTRIGSDYRMEKFLPERHVIEYVLNPFDEYMLYHADESSFHERMERVK